MNVGRPVRRLAAGENNHRAQDLGGFQGHLDDMLVGVEPGAGRNVVIEHEDVHRTGPAV
jgi:hypothetical protein